MKKEVYVFHEYGAPEHYLGLEYLLSSNGNNVKYITYTCVKPLMKALLKRDTKKAITVIHDFFFIATCCLRPAKLTTSTIVIGCAPLDWRILMLLRLSKFGYVVYHSSWVDWSGSKYPKSTRVFKRYIREKWLFFLQSRVSRFALVTPEVQQQLVKYQKVNPARCLVVYHSFNESIFYYRDRPISEIKHFVFVGRLVEEKGIDIIFNIASHLLDCRFSIVGDGRLANEVVEKCVANENVKYLGFMRNRDELARLYQSADFILQPSLRTNDWEELFGIALVEAMACGVIPFSSDHVGPQTLLVDSSLVNNLLNESDFAEQVVTMVRSYQNEPDVIRGQRQEAIKIAKQYNRQSIAKVWNELIERV